MGNLRQILSKFLFPAALFLLGFLFLLVSLKPGKAQSGMFLIASLSIFLMSVLMFLLSAGIIKKKIAGILTLILLPVIGLLAYDSYASINDDIQYEKQVASRYNAVKSRLEMIREAQILYKSVHEEYCANFDTLINFIKTGSVKEIVKVGDDEDSLAMRSGDKSKWSRDTVYKKILGYKFPGEYPVDSLKFIPYSKDSIFKLQAAFLGAAESEYNPPVFEASASFKSFLGDLSEKYGRQVKDSLIKVGSMSEPTTNGNWR